MSANRFAALKNGMSRSISSTGIGRDGAVPLLWSSSQGGVGMLLHAPHSMGEVLYHYCSWVDYS